MCTICFMNLTGILCQLDKIKCIYNILKNNIIDNLIDKYEQCNTSKLSITLMLN